jgi:hypothetical protein
MTTTPSTTAGALKVLMTGHLHSVFIHPLAIRLKRERPMEISALELLSFGHETLGIDQPVYDRVFQLEPLPDGPGKLAALWRYCRSLPRGRRWATVHRWFQQPSLAAFRAKFRDDYRLFTRTETVRPLMRGYDLYHLHFMDHALSSTLPGIPPGAPVVLSIWGSDLMDMAGPDLYAEQLAICERADIITLRSYAMREIFLAKYGRRFLPKIRLAKFGIRNLPMIDALSRPEARNAFCARHQIDPRKAVVCLGHSGARRDRHELLLQTLSPHAATLNREATLVMPMTYNLVRGYVDQVREAVRRSGLDVRILTDYMTPEEVAALRLASDVMVALPEQDALSGAMCETIYAGNWVITGAWLPYMELWDQGVKLCRIGEFAELPEALLGALARRDSLRSELEGNQAKVRPLVDYDYSVNDWLAAYDSALATAKNLPSLKTP